MDSQWTSLDSAEGEGVGEGVGAASLEWKVLGVRCSWLGVAAEE